MITQPLVILYSETYCKHNHTIKGKKNFTKRLLSTLSGGHECCPWVGFWREPICKSPDSCLWIWSPICTGSTETPAWVQLPIHCWHRWARCCYIVSHQFSGWTWCQCESQRCRWWLQFGGTYFRIKPPVVSFNCFIDIAWWVFDEFPLDSSMKRVDLPSPKRSTKIPVAFSDLFFKPCIYLGPEVISIWDTTRLFSSRLFLTFLLLSGVRRVFVLLLIIKIVVVVFFLVEKKVLVLICKATLIEKRVMGWV